MHALFCIRIFAHVVQRNTIYYLEEIYPSKYPISLYCYHWHRAGIQFYAIFSFTKVSTNGVTGKLEFDDKGSPRRENSAYNIVILTEEGWENVS